MLHSVPLLICHIKLTASVLAFLVVQTLIIEQTIFHWFSRINALKMSCPSLESRLYESTCATLRHFNLCEQVDAISRPALLTS